jgi:hypothetical protein
MTLCEQANQNKGNMIYVIRKPISIGISYLTFDDIGIVITNRRVPFVVGGTRLEVKSSSLLI